ncbi:competence/damage-inducible protein A [Henriciella litoralis]|uniref:competence/damage-inducible protein A n=1 Tax=Henriciella litoralis TaxID=568102 RepID=UPI0009FDF8C2|nr:molybdopterin-binding protein [Henriciella litoralis]
MTKKTVTAAICLIGDELLSGRTRDINTQQIARFLAPLGIPVREVRTVPDEQDEIVAAVNALRARYTYVFTTGGIGPTHDDITADAIAAAFGVSIGHDPEVFADLQARYDEMGTEFTEARQRMARLPHGASPIANPVSGAPGFQTGNVFTLAGVPSIVLGMLQDIGHRLEHGVVIHSVTIRAPGLREGDVAEKLSQIANDADGINVGSYPWFRSLGDNGVSLVARGADQDALEKMKWQLIELAKAAGSAPELVDGEGD